MPEIQYRFMETRIQALEDERDQYRSQRDMAVASVRKVLKVVTEELIMLAHLENK